MKVILCESVSNLGEMGETVKVTDGYARNFLFPRKLAVGIESASAKQLEHEMRIIKKREETRRAELAEYAKKVEGVTVEIKARAGENDKIFGSVGTAHIAKALKELGHVVERKNIKLDAPIKELGVFTVPVRLGFDIEANVKVWVTGEETEEAGAEQETQDTGRELLDAAIREADAAEERPKKAQEPTEESTEAQTEVPVSAQTETETEAEEPTETE